MATYYMGIDQGTTGTTVMILDGEFTCVAKGYREHTQYYPQPGWVEHDPAEIMEKIREAAKEALETAGISADKIACIGLDNQGETVALWDKVTGKPLCPAIVWQDRRTAEFADILSAQHADLIRERTGLVVDAYFSATKIKWVLDNVPQAREWLSAGRLCAGTLDAWMLWNLTGGKVFATDPSTASRTMLYNIHTGTWDKDILNILEIPESILPVIRPTAGIFGETDPAAFFGARVPISGSVCDQQAALFGQVCLEPGSVKVTYGTGCFLLLNTGEKPIYSDNGLLTTVAWQLAPGKTTYALDGGIYIAGAAIQWLRDKLQIIHSAAETEAMAKSVADTAGVFFVPAFAGLAAPYWDPYARGTLVGITSATAKEHIVRAALESICYQVKDILDLIDTDIQVLRADGGACENDFLMQFQADILGIPVDVPENTETTALGAACLAAYGIGALTSLEDVKRKWKLKKRYLPQMDAQTRTQLLQKWHKAVARAKDWATD